ncbi:MAG: hypothetical protein QOD98_3440 [Nocardioidaceae bacterium]|nr:hypothetical protein [Nocardioidaceae bacterium]
MGDDTKVWHQAQLLAGAWLGRECIVGKGAFLSSTASVGALVKIDNYARVMGAPAPGGPGIATTPGIHVVAG